MNIKSINKYSLILTLILISGLIYILYCREKHPISHSVVTEYQEEKYYLLNPERVLDDLDNGTPITLSPISESLKIPPVPNKSYSWRQFDFLKLAVYIDDYAWKDNRYNNWMVSNILFRGDCATANLGFDTFSIRYSHLSKSNDIVSRLVGVFLTINRVETGQDVLPSIPFWDFGLFPIDSVEITADTALRIADENGGRKAREFAKNECYANVDFFSKKGGWRVEYKERKSGESIFLIFVDSTTGKVKNGYQ